MTIEVPVLVVGGGPVGLTLGIELAWRGTPALVVEERTAPTEHPKATLLGSRSMELYRRWGLAEAILDAALPDDEHYRILFTTRLARHELHRFTSPSLRQVRDRAAAGRERFAELAWSPYSKTQIGQQALEPVLLRHADGWVTAYAHADRVLVAVDEEVAIGQTIATVGSTGEVASPQLHFEIRRGTEPVDPAQYLAAR